VSASKIPVYISAKKNKSLNQILIGPVKGAGKMDLSTRLLLFA